MIVMKITNKCFMLLAFLLLIIIIKFDGSLAMSHWRSIESEFRKNPYNREYIVYAVEEAQKGVWHEDHLARYDALTLFMTLVDYGTFVDYEPRYEAAAHVAKWKKGSSAHEYRLALELFYKLVERERAYAEAIEAVEEGISRGRRELDGWQLLDKSLQLLRMLAVRGQAWELAVRVACEEAERYISIPLLDLMSFLISAGHKEEAFVARARNILEKIEERESERVLTFAVERLRNILESYKLL